MQARKRQEKNYECGWLDSRTQAVNGKGLKAVEWNDKCAYPLYSPELAALSLPLLRRSSNAVVVGILVTLLLMIGTRTLLVLHPRLVLLDRDPIGVRQVVGEYFDGLPDAAEELHDSTT